MSVFSLGDEWECLYEILTGHLLLCSSVRELDLGPVVSSSSLRPSAGYRHEGGFQEGGGDGGGPLSPRRASPKSSGTLGINAPDLRGDGASKLRQPARSLYTPQGPLICKRHCLPSDPWGANWVFVTLLKGCFQHSLAAIYVRLCRTAVWSQRPWQKAQDPFGEAFFYFKGLLA